MIDSVVKLNEVSSKRTLGSWLLKCAAFNLSFITPPPTSLLSTEVTDGHVQEISVCVLDDPTQNLHVSIFIAALAKNESNYVSKKWRL